MPTYLSWDSGLNWDSGLSWDAAPAVSVTDYVELVTSEHAVRPNFVAMLEVLLQPIVDNTAAINLISPSYDIDHAAGKQLDTVGLWAGISRNLRTPLTGVYFSLDTTGVGFDQGTWLGPFDATSGLTALPDEQYRTLLRAKIAANHWDGTIPSAYDILNQLFSGRGYTALIQDNGDMTMAFGLVGGAPDAVTLALLTGGYLSLKPSGVHVSGYFTNSVPNTLIFGFDSSGPSIGGFDSASWATQLSPS